MLATCKQACDEAYAVFFSSNCFFLPTGPIEHARSALKAIQPHYRDMIKTFGLVLSQNDLTPAVFEQAYQAMLGRWGTSLKDRPSGQDFTQAEQWGILVAAELREGWKQKYNLALTASKGLGHLKYRVASNLEERNARNTGGLVAFVDAENDMRDWPLEIRQQVWSTARLIWARVEAFVVDEGWKALRKTVSRGGFAWTDWYD